MATLQDLIDQYNAKAAKPIKSWKQKRELLEQRIAALNGETTAAIPATTEVQPEVQPKFDEGTVMAIKKAAKKAVKKTPAKKAAKGKSVNKPGNKPRKAQAPRENTLKSFIADLHAKGKGNAEILEAATAKGFETTYKSIASIRSRLGK